MKTLITPIGFTTTQTVSFIVKDGIGRGDRVFFLRPKEDPIDERAKKAYNEIKELITKIDPDIEVQLLMFDVSTFDRLLIDLASFFHNLKSDEIVVNNSGGVKEITIALTAVNILFNHKISRTYNFSWLERQMKEIHLPYLACPIEGTEKQLLLALIKYGPLTYNILTKKLELSKSTISRIVTRLEDKKLVSTEEIGKENKVEATTTAKLLIMIS